MREDYDGRENNQVTSILLCSFDFRMTGLGLEIYSGYCLGVTVQGNLFIP
jgi:hypothetical protein